MMSRAVSTTLRSRSSDSRRAALTSWLRRWDISNGRRLSTMNRLAARSVLELSSRVRTRMSDFRRARCWMAAISCTPTPSLSALRPMSQASWSAASPRPATYSWSARAYCLARSRSSDSRGPEISHDEDERVVGLRAPPREHVVGERLRLLIGQRRVEKLAADSVGRNDQHVAPADAGGPGHEPRQMGADDASPHEERVGRRAARDGRPQEPALDVTDAEPRHRLVGDLERRGTDHGAARSDQALVAVPEELSERPIPAALERPRRHLRGARGFGTVSQAVHDRDESAVRGGQNQVTVSGFALARLGELGDGPLDRRADQRLHRRTVMVVPFP